MRAIRQEDLVVLEMIQENFMKRNHIINMPLLEWLALVEEEVFNK